MILTRLNSVLNHLNPIKLLSIPSTTVRTMTTQPISLYSVATPNGSKITIALEELKAAGNPIEWKEIKIDFSKNEQKEPWFLAINPNGRIPAILDHNRNEQRVWETGSILLYLVKYYDPNFILHFENESDETEMISWVFFQHSGLGPFLGNAGFFLSAETKDAFAAKRFINESKRLFSVYETALSEKDYLVGSGRGKFSLADIVAFPWVRAIPYSLGEISLKELGFPLLDAWKERIESRVGTKKALEDDMITGLLKKEDWKEIAKKRSEWVWKEEEGEKK